MDPWIQEEGVRPLPAGSGVFEAATLALLLTGTEEKTKSREIQPQPVLAKASYHHWGPVALGGGCPWSGDGQAGVSESLVRAATSR